MEKQACIPDADSSRAGSSESYPWEWVACDNRNLR